MRVASYSLDSISNDAICENLVRTSVSPWQRSRFVPTSDKLVSGMGNRRVFTDMLASDAGYINVNDVEYGPTDASERTKEPEQFLMDMEALLSA